MSTHLLPAVLLPPVLSWTPLPAGSCPAEEVGEGEKEQLEGEPGGEAEERSQNCSCRPQRTQQAPEAAAACSRP